MLKLLAISGWLTAIVLAVGTLDYNIEVAAEHERQGQRFQDCKCKPEIKGRQFVASLCQAPTIRGPWLHECVYEKEM